MRQSTAVAYSLRVMDLRGTAWTTRRCVVDRAHVQLMLPHYMTHSMTSGCIMAQATALLPTRGPVLQMRWQGCGRACTERRWWIPQIWMMHCARMGSSQEAATIMICCCRLQ